MKSRPRKSDSESRSGSELRISRDQGDAVIREMNKLLEKMNLIQESIQARLEEQ